MDEDYTSGTVAAPEARHYPHWWQNALAEIRNGGRISTWARDVVAARAFYEPGQVSIGQRAAWFREAFDMALYCDDRARVGGWSPVECIQKTWMSYEQMMADPSRPRDLASLREALRELGNPNVEFYGRDRLIKLGERMLAAATAR